MGYWGYLVAAKSDVPLSELPELSALGDEVLEVEPLHSGWQQAWVAGQPDDPLKAARTLAQATARPVLAALILDSDCGPVAGATPEGTTWTGTLAKSTAIDSYEMRDDGVTPTAAVTSFRSWSQSAGLPCDESLTTEALNPDGKGPESLFTLLLKATGIRTQ